MMPLQRPSDHASEEERAAYRKERRRRVIVKAARRARIERRETPHDSAACEVCKQNPKKDAYDATPMQIAERAKVSLSHVYRVISDNPRTARGRRTLETLRRIAHDGLGVSLDELAAIVLD